MGGYSVTTTFPGHHILQLILIGLSLALLTGGEIFDNLLFIVLQNRHLCYPDKGPGLQDFLQTSSPQKHITLYPCPRYFSVMCHSSVSNLGRCFYNILKNFTFRLCKDTTIQIKIQICFIFFICAECESRTHSP